MKKSFLIFIFAALFFSCENERTEITVSLGTPAVENITKTSAYLKSTVNVSDNNNVICGFCWGKTQSPTIKHNKIERIGNGNMEEIITNLTSGSVYYVRTYAIISSEPVYSDEIMFATEPEAPTVVTTLPPENITDTSAVFKANIPTTDNNNVTYGFCWSTEQYPTVGNNKIEKTGKGNVVETVTGLSANTAYYLRAYAVIASDTVYGNEIRFVTQSAALTVEVTTLPPENITDTSAVFRANISTSDDNDVTYGFCRSTEQYPTVENNKIEKTGKGDVVETVTGLSANTVYYLRAYAIIASDTVYGNEVWFTTTP
jgi:hypothetical protein